MLFLVETLKGSPAIFMLKGELPEDWMEVSTNAQDRGIFIKGGDKPDYDKFWVMVDKIKNMAGY